MNTRELLTILSNSTGVSGHEYAFSSVIKQAFEEFCTSVYQDATGNIIGIRKCKKEKTYKVMLAAHMDEIGLMVKDIDDRGFISFTNIGGVDSRILLAQEVIVHGKEDLFGIIGAKPPHLQTEEESKKAVEIKDMAIDVGMDAKKVKELVSIGDIITFRSPTSCLLNNYLSGKSFDDRAGIICIIECLKELKNTDIDVDVSAVATVQGKVGL